MNRFLTGKTVLYFGLGMFLVVIITGSIMIDNCNVEAYPICG